MKPIDVIMVKNKAIHSVGMLIAREFIVKMVSFIGQIILFRILSPGHFGYFVMISFIVSFFDLFSDIGLYSATIQREKKPKKEELSTIFFLRVLLSAFLTLSLFFMAGFFKKIYPQLQSEHITMIRILSVILILKSIRSVPVSLLERSIQYNIIARVDVAGVLIYQVVAILLALNHFAIWSLIIALLMKETIETILVFYYKPFFPFFIFNFEKIKAMSAYGAFIQGGGILHSIRASIIPVIAGIKLGSTSVGLLDWASSFSSIPQSITDNYGRVAFSGFSRIQKKDELLASAIEKSIGILSIITLLFTVTIFGFGMDFTSYIYTTQWTAGLPALYWFAASTFFIAVMSPLGQGILVRGRSKDIFFITLVMNIIEWILAYILIHLFQFIGIAIASSLVSVLAFGSYFFIARRCNIYIPVFSILFPKFITFGVTLTLIFLMNLALPHTILLLIVKTIFAIITYCIFTYLLSREDFLFLASIAYSGVRGKEFEKALKKRFQF